MNYVSAAAACGYAWGVFQATQVTTILDAAKSTAISAVATAVFARAKKTHKNDFHVVGLFIVPVLSGYQTYKTGVPLGPAVLVVCALSLASFALADATYSRLGKIIPR